jgi:predicted ribonuclease YlaK
VGENARIFFDGDYKNQIDKKIFRNRNGLKLLTELHKTSEANLFATVRLNSVERSKVARLADILDELD